MEAAPLTAPTNHRTALRVLMVEDRASDAALVVHELIEAGFAPDWQRVETEAAYLARLDPALDVILADYTLPAFSGLDALRLLRQRGLRIPFILITGTAGEDAAVSALQQGADDYLLKDRLARLGPAVTRALEQRDLHEASQRAQRELRESELRLLHQERTARAEAEAAVRLRDQFLAIASHELRTPVTVIKGSAQLLLRQFGDERNAPPDVLGRLRGINQMSDRLTLLIGDMLDVSRLRSGQLVLRTEVLDLAELVQELATQERGQLGDRHPIRLTSPGNLPRVQADPHRIQQVVSNLIENAIKYSPAGGSIDIDLSQDDRGVLIRVSDQGIGLAADEFELIFEPFGRAANAQRRQLPGMGLGLYIARQIVQQHGGRMWADSEGEDRGTSIGVWLPAETGAGHRRVAEPNVGSSH